MIERITSPPETERDKNPRRPIQRPARDVVLAFDACFNEPTPPSKAIHPGADRAEKPAAPRMSRDWQAKASRPQARRGSGRTEVFLDFDPVCPEWPHADD